MIVVLQNENFFEGNKTSKVNIKTMGMFFLIFSSQKRSL